MSLGTKRNGLVYGVLACLAAAAGSADAQICWVHRAGVPDFDQKRDGLGNDGKMHCVPTAWTNWFAYLEDNGYAGIMNGDGTPRNWQSSSQYNLVTNRISALGNHLGTSPTNGTSYTGPELMGWVDSHLDDPAFLIFIRKRVQPGGNLIMVGPSPKFAAGMLQMGGMVTMGIGWCTEQPGYIHKAGGHLVSLTGVYGMCDSKQSVRYRDPGSSDSYFSQGAFVSTLSTTTKRSEVFKFNDNPMPYAVTAYQIDGYDGNTKGFLLGIASLILNFGVGIDTQSGKLAIVRPHHFSHNPLPEIEPVDFPELGNIVDLQLGSTMTDAFVSVGGNTPGIWKIDLALGEHKPFLPVSKPGPLAVGRFGELFVIDGPNIRKIDPDTEREVARVEPGGDVMHIAYDDDRDELVAIDSEKKRLLQIDRNLRVLENRGLPNGLTPSEKMIIAVHPITHELWASAGDGSVFEITRPRAGEPTMQSFVLPGVAECTGMQFLPDGGLTVLADGSVREFHQDENGKFQETKKSGFAGRKFSGLLRLARSSDDTPDEMLNFQEPEVDPPTQAPDEVIECPSDHDGSGFVDTDDFTAFVMDFEAGILRADFDRTGFVDTDDFTAFVLAFESGC